MRTSPTWKVYCVVTGPRNNTASCRMHCSRDKRDGGISTSHWNLRGHLEQNLYDQSASVYNTEPNHEDNGVVLPVCCSLHVVITSTFFIGNLIKMEGTYVFVNDEADLHILIGRKTSGAKELSKIELLSLLLQAAGKAV
jgi:hypothetical protein